MTGTKHSVMENGTDVVVHVRETPMDRMMRLMDENCTFIPILCTPITLLLYIQSSILPTFFFQESRLATVLYELSILNLVAL